MQRYSLDVERTSRARWVVQQVNGRGWKALGGCGSEVEVEVEVDVVLDAVVK